MLTNPYSQSCFFQALPGASLIAQLVKNSPATWETWSIPGLGRSPGEGEGYALQYSGLENSMDYMLHGVRVGHDWATFTFTPRWHSGKESTCQYRSDPWVRKTPGEGNDNPLVFLLGKSLGQRSLACYSSRGQKKMRLDLVTKPPIHDFFSSRTNVRADHKRRLSTEGLKLLNCSAGEDSWVPWTARRLNQSILKEINPEYSLDGLMLKL